MATSLLIMTAAATQVADGEARAPSAPIAVQAVATARIVSGAQIRFVGGEVVEETTGKAEPQIRRDSAGTLWVEFS
jgi:hypothetical protein